MQIAKTTLRGGIAGPLLEDQTIVVTGAAGGIGRVVSAVLAEALHQAIEHQQILGRHVPLDFIPADFVVAGMILALAELLEELVEVLTQCLRTFLFLPVRVLATLSSMRATREVQPVW